MAEGLKKYCIFMVICCMVLILPANGTTYYLDAAAGDDAYPGTSELQPFRTLERVQGLTLFPGDTVCLAAGQVFQGTLQLRDVQGTPGKPVVVTTYPSGVEKAMIDAAGYAEGILVLNGAHVRIEHIGITANGTAGERQPGGTPGGNAQSTDAGRSLPEKNPDMRCGVLVTADQNGEYENIVLHDLHVSNIFYHDAGHTRSKGEVKTANGTGRYGWGIRLINRVPGAVLKEIQISDSRVNNVSHTGIKLTTRDAGIRDVVISGCEVTLTGGPGIQMSGVQQVVATNNLVNHSGSNDDSRKWGRGSGLWTWSSTDVLIEHNQFRNANGPGDSAGCHIDFNCRNVIVQYNLSYHNAGGFIEILGNNYNCAYRYNISVNDGYRVKGENGAFQEGKIFWLSGYRGDREQTGPFNSYIYNNTIFTDDELVAKIAVTRTASGVLVANNIFCMKGACESVPGDQYRPEKKGAGDIPGVVFKNNLFMHAANWPESILIRDEAPLYGDPGFRAPGGDRLEDYVPRDALQVKDRGIEIPLLPGDEMGLVTGLRVTHDILGNPVFGKPDLGAIEMK